MNLKLNEWFQHPWLVWSYIHSHTCRTSTQRFQQDLNDLHITDWQDGGNTLMPPHVVAGKGCRGGRCLLTVLLLRLFWGVDGIPAHLKETLCVSKHKPGSSGAVPCFLDCFHFKVSCHSSPRCVALWWQGQSHWRTLKLCRETGNT